jgi:hypothetical protein
MQNIYNIHYYYWHIYKERKNVLDLISLDQDISCCNKPWKKFKKIVLTKNSKSNNFKFVTLMDALKNVKANEIVPYKIMNQQITKDSLVKCSEFSTIHGRGT